MQTTRTTRFLWLTAILILSLACSIQTGSTPPPPASPPTAMPQPTLPPPPIVIPFTDTPAFTDTPVPTPTPEGPKIVDDDFSTDTGRFQCKYCKVQDGVLNIGPYPSVDSFEGFLALCGDCGSVASYTMSVDTWYVEGPSDRGFGLVLRHKEDGSYIDLEVTTWQVYGVWKYDPTFNTGWQGWEGITDGWVGGGLKPGRAVNHIEVTVQSGAGRSTLTIKINGGNTRIVEIPSGSGRVGLIVGMHSIGAGFDNFHFEPLP